MKAVFAALLACAMGCAFAQTVSAAEPAKYSEKVLYSFCSQKNCKDGSGPTTLIDVKGTLYGTTVGGGITGCGGYGCGTAFSFDLVSGAEKVLYGFCKQPNCADGESPNGGLIDVKGTLYGTTNEGGSGGVAGARRLRSTRTRARRCCFTPFAARRIARTAHIRIPDRLM